MCSHASQIADLTNTLQAEESEDEWEDPEERRPTTAHLLFNALCCCPLMKDLKLVGFHFWCVALDRHMHTRVRVASAAGLQLRASKLHTRYLVWAARVGSRVGMRRHAMAAMLVCN